MSVRLCVGDVVLVKPIKAHQCIGLIKYVGPMVDHDVMSEYVGIELLESIPKGHNGTIDGFTYFTTSQGYGCHTKTTNVIKKLLIKDLFKETKKLYNVFQTKLKHISKLESLLDSARKSRSETPPKININLPCHGRSPDAQSNSVHSRFSQLTNAYSLASPIPTQTYHSHSVARKLNLQNINSNHRVHPRRSSSISSYSTKSSFSSDDSDSSSELEKEKKPRNEYSKKKSSTLRRSHSTSTECERQYFGRKRSKTAGLQHKSSQNVLISHPYTNNMNMSHIYNNNNYNPYQHRLPAPVPAPPLISESKSSPLILVPLHQSAQSAPASPYISYLEHQHYSSATNLSIPQSNTQMVDDVPFIDMQRSQPSNTVSPMSQNMFMVNNAYSPSPYGAGHYYNDPSASHISPISHSSLGFTQTAAMANYNDVSNHSTPITNAMSPYSAQLAAYNEYRHQHVSNPNVSNLSMHSHPGPIGKMYQMQKNGHDILYQHK